MIFGRRFGDRLRFVLRVCLHPVVGMGYSNFDDLGTLCALPWLLLSFLLISLSKRTALNAIGSINTSKHIVFPKLQCTECLYLIHLPIEIYSPKKCSLKN